MLERIKHENTVDIYGHVTVLRTQRQFMVQTKVSHHIYTCSSYLFLLSYVYLSIYLHAHLPYPSVILSIYPSTYMPAHRTFLSSYVYLSVCIHVTISYLSVILPIYPSIYMPIHLTFLSSYVY